ncbi:hypothetical protein EV714DRAFT_268750 [Schizophyllum commune]
MSHHSSHRSSRAHHRHHGSGQPAQHPESHPLQPLPSGTMPSSFPASSQSAPNLHPGAPHPHASPPFQPPGTYPYAAAPYMQAGAQYPHASAPYQQASASYPQAWANSQASASHSRTSVQTSSTAQHPHGHPQFAHQQPRMAGNPTSSTTTIPSSHSTGVRQPQHASEARNRREGRPQPAIDRLTAAGVPTLPSEWFDDSDSRPVPREAADIVRQVLYGLAQQILGKNYNINRTLVENINTFLPNVSGYKPDRANVLVMNMLNLIKWLVEFGEVEKDAKAVLNALKHLGAQSLVSEGPNAGSSVNTFSSRAVFSVRPPSAVETQDLSSTLMSIITLKMNEVAHEIQDAHGSSASDMSAADLTNVIYIEDIIYRGFGDEDSEFQEESLDVLCARLEHSDFYTSPQARIDLLAWLRRHISAIVATVSAGVAAVGTYMQNMTSMVINTAAAVSIVIVLATAWNALKGSYAKKLNEEFSTPKVHAAARKVVGKLQDVGLWNLLANANFAKAVRIMLRLRRGELHLPRKDFVKLALLFNSYIKYDYAQPNAIRQMTDRFGLTARQEEPGPLAHNTRPDHHFGV